MKRKGVFAVLAVVAIVGASATVTLGRGGLSGKYSGKIRHGGPVERKIVFKVTRKRAKLVELPLDIDCTFQTGEHISEVITGGSGKLKHQFKQLGGEINFKIRKRVEDFHEGTLKVSIDAGFRGKKKKIVGTFLADLDYGDLGNCGDGGDFRAK
jgi:hypothetical protein